MKIAMDILLILGSASVMAALWSLQPGQWQAVKNKVLLPSFLAMLVFGVPGYALNAYLN
jgi:hypothetical protein